ncbi:hypothetical protein PIROE2DRAFT_59081 [Piromyces sp. E2]|nr:hypothetical protein PIROE2DRAFT_59081 [Piromyces sp. E2]|eukprot:OUM66901.1 hypothetical protein PIROE2DRAFT_59081 [Piromyces sp. E2]
MSIPFLKKSNKKPFLVLKHINFKAFENEIFMIVGPKNSGKSTLFKIMVGLTQASSGEISFNGTIINEKQKINYQQIGFCPQWNAFYDELTLEDHINFVAENIWELPISSLDNFVELNRIERIYDENQNHLNRNSLYLPSLEEKYLHMGDKIHGNDKLEDNDWYEIEDNDDTSLIINTNKPKELPNIKNMEKIKPTNIKHLIIIYNYRVHNYLRYENIVSYAILFPLSVIGMIASMAIYSTFMVNYGNYSTFSSDLYYNVDVNLPLNFNRQPSTLIWNINPENTTIPAITNP